MTSTTYNTMLEPALARAFASLTPSPSSIAVAVSGGGDSMALVLSLARYLANQSISLVALTVDHGLRSEAAEEARQVHAWLSDKAITHHILTWTPPSGLSSNIQAEARKARYGLMIEWCKAHQCTSLWLAHHLQDQVETLWMRLERGSSVTGLAAMRPFSERDGITLVRPFLSVPKPALLGFLQEERHAWIDDPSNQKTEFTRVKIRQHLTNYQPATPGVDNALFAARMGELAIHMQRVEDALTFYVEEAWKKAVTWQGISLTADWSVIEELPEEIRYRLLQRMLQTINGSADTARFAELQRLLEAITAGAMKNRTLAGCMVRREKEKLIIEKETRFLES